MRIVILFFSLFVSANAFALNVTTPVKTVVGTGAYTVPAGRWARVVVNLSASARVSSSAGTLTALSGTGNSDSRTIELLLKSGDVISSSLTNASGTTSCVSLMTLASSESSASLVVNSTTVATVRAPAVGHCNAGSGANSVTMTGFSSYGYVASEYFN